MIKIGRIHRIPRLCLRQVAAGQDVRALRVQGAEQGGDHQIPRRADEFREISHGQTPTNTEEERSLSVTLLPSAVSASLRLCLSMAKIRLPYALSEWLPPIYLDAKYLA